MINLAQVPNLFFKNRKFLEGSTLAGCVKCRKSFQPKDIVSFTDKEQTCICPQCGHDTLIFDNMQITINEDYLNKAHNYLFKKY